MKSYFKVNNFENNTLADYMPMQIYTSARKKCTIVSEFFSPK